MSNTGLAVLANKGKGLLPLASSSTPPCAWPSVPSLAFAHVCELLKGSEVTADTTPLGEEEPHKESFEVKFAQHEARKICHSRYMT